MQFTTEKNQKLNIIQPAGFDLSHMETYHSFLSNYNAFDVGWFKKSEMLRLDLQKICFQVPRDS